MAVGIAAFALITIIGLQPVGLTTMRGSMDTTIETQIIKQITGEINLTDFAQIEKYEDNPLYFDADGLRAPTEADARFQVKVKVVPPSPSFSPFPSSPADIDTSLKTIRVEIRLLPFREGTSASSPPNRVQVFHVARSDKLL